MRVLRPLNALIGSCLVFVIVAAVLAFMPEASGPAASAMNPPPVAGNDFYTVHRSMIPLAPSVLANDSGSNIKICGFVTNPAHGSASRTDYEINYTAHAGYVGPDSFVYRICDNQFQTAQATVSINIVNQNPVAVPDYFRTQSS